MAGCPGCLPSQKEKQQQLESKEKEAKKYAQEIKGLVVLFYRVDGQADFMEAEAAKLEGVQPIKFVPYVPGVANEQVS